MVSPRQLAVVVGVSSYPSPFSPLPGVANDVREIAKLLTPTAGADPTLLDDAKATKSEVENALQAAFSTARQEDTLFVYLAGHGAVANEHFYYVPFDGKASNWKDSCLALWVLRDWFDSTKCARTFLFLDFCHSGGVQRRGVSKKPVPKTHVSASLIQRALNIEGGHGKFIVTACDEREVSWEDGEHGLFTRALLRGLQGEAPLDQDGKLTFFSLYDFVAKDVRHCQTITCTSSIQGRPVLSCSQFGIRESAHNDAESSPMTENQMSTHATSTRVLNTLAVHEGKNSLEQLSLSQLDDTGSFRWLNISPGTNKHMIFERASDGIRVQCFPHVVRGDSRGSYESVVIPYGLSSEFRYRPRGAPLDPTFEIRAPEEGVIELVDVEANASIRFRLHRAQ